MTQTTRRKQVSYDAYLAHHVGNVEIGGLVASYDSHLPGYVSVVWSSTAHPIKISSINTHITRNTTRIEARDDGGTTFESKHFWLEREPSTIATEKYPTTVLL